MKARGYPPLSTKLRVAWFVLESDLLVPRFSFDGSALQNPVQGPRRLGCEQRFQVVRNPSLRAMSPANSAVVAAAYQASVVYVSNAEASNGEPTNPFFFTTSSQKHYLRSLVALPLQGLNQDGICPSLLCIDTSVAGFFDSHLDEPLGIIREYVEPRIRCESNIEELLNAMTKTETAGRSRKNV